MIATGSGPVTFSVQQLIDCQRPPQWGANGCNGGGSDEGILYTSTLGLATEAAYGGVRGAGRKKPRTPMCRTSRC